MKTGSIGGTAAVALLSAFSVDKAEGEESDTSGVLVGRTFAPLQPQATHNVVAQVIAWKQTTRRVNNVLVGHLPNCLEGLHTEGPHLPGMEGLNRQGPHSPGMEGLHREGPHLPGMEGQDREGPYSPDMEGLHRESPYLPGMERLHREGPQLLVWRDCIEKAPPTWYGETA